MKIAIILGTRPEIIKMSPIIRELTERKVDFFILHTNQHYSGEMDKVFFEELLLPQPKYNLSVHDLPQGAMVGQMLIGIEPILIKERPNWVLVEGDTNTVMAGAIAASKLGVHLGHVEAGLRSYDRTMPEELNRIVADHLSDLLFCPTDISVKIALGEGIPKDKVHMTGNTIVDAVEQNLAIGKKSKFVSLYKNQNFLTLTMHRPSNVDNKQRLSEVIRSLERLSTDLGLPIYFPLHPRTKAKLEEFGITPDKSKIKVLPPVSYLEMLTLEKNAQLILTDSGGVQEEACILKVPCVTLRSNTERPETIDVGANTLSEVDPDLLLKNAQMMLTKDKSWINPYGSGKAAKAIIEIILKSQA